MTVCESTADFVPVRALRRRHPRRYGVFGPLTPAELARLDETSATLARYERPRRRADCEPGGLNAARPCPFVSCSHHLYLAVDGTGAIKLNFEGREVWQMPATCALDIAERSERTLEEVGEALNVTRERVRQIEAKALRKYAKAARRAGLAERPSRLVTTAEPQEVHGETATESNPGPRRDPNASE